MTETANVKITLNFDAMSQEPIEYRFEHKGATGTITSAHNVNDWTLVFDEDEEDFELHFGTLSEALCEIAQIVGFEGGF